MFNSLPINRLGIVGRWAKDGNLATVIGTFVYVHDTKLPWLVVFSITLKENAHSTVCSPLSLCLLFFLLYYLLTFFF